MNISVLLRNFETHKLKKKSLGKCTLNYGMATTNDVSVTTLQIQNKMSLISDKNKSLFENQIRFVMWVRLVTF